MDNYYFKLVCVDEQNPLGFFVLEDEVIETLDDVHKFVEEHIKEHTPEVTKWMLLPMRKDEVKYM